MRKEMSMGEIPEGRKPLTWNDLTPKHSSWEAEAKALRAENERLREAHLAIIETTEGLPGAVIQECRQIARAALGGGQ